MDYESVMAVEALIKEIGALALVLSGSVLMIVQLIKSADIINTRWMPFVSIGIGSVAAMIMGGYLGGDLFIFGMAGAAAGFGSSGFYDAAKALKGGK